MTTQTATPPSPTLSGRDAGVSAGVEPQPITRFQESDLRMSRIADALQKARDESAARGPSQPDPEDARPRPIAEVQIPWSLEEPANVAPPPSVVHPPDARGPAEVPRLTPVPRRVVPVPAAAPATAAASVRNEDPQAIERLVRILFLATEEGGSAVRRVLLTTVGQSRGCTEIAPLLAEALAAQVSGTVCLADLDQHTPTLHERYPLEGKLSFSEAAVRPGPLRGCAHRAPSITNLWLMPASQPAVDASPAILHDSETHRRLGELLATFDYLVAFTGPIADQTEAMLLGTMLDGIVLFVDANRTTSEAVRAAADVLDRAKVRLIGTVVNNGAHVRPAAPGRT